MRKIILAIFFMSSTISSFARCVICWDGHGCHTFKSSYSTCKSNRAAIEYAQSQGISVGCADFIKPGGVTGHNDGTATIIIDGVTKQLCSDKLAKALDEIMDGKPTNESFGQRLKEALKSDDGFVSVERLTELSKELGVPLKVSQKFVTQSNARKGWNGTIKGGHIKPPYSPTDPNVNKDKEIRPPYSPTDPNGDKSKERPRASTIISIGASSIMPTSQSKTNLLISNSLGINADVYIPLIVSRKGWNGVNGKIFGINIGGSYGGPGKSGTGPTNPPPPFAVSGQTGASTVSELGVDARNPGFRIGAGPQINFHFGQKAFASVIVRGEYFSMTQKAVSAVQTTSYNGSTTNITIWNRPETKTGGFAVTPEIRLNYVLSSSICFFAQGSYVAGPKVKNTSTKLVPNGSPNQQGAYTLQQLQTGTMQKTEPENFSGYRAASFGGGISFCFIGKKRVVANYTIDDKTDMSDDYRSSRKAFGKMRRRKP